MSGVLPAVFAALVGQLAGLLPTVVADGPASDSGRRLLMLLGWLAVVLVAQELASAGYEVTKWAFYRRYEQYVLGRVIAATVSTDRLELFEDPALAGVTERAVRLAEWEPGDLVDGWWTRWLRLAEGLAAAVLVATIWPGAAMVALVWLIAGAVVQRGLRRADANLWGPALQGADYLTRIVERPAWAKEVRVFGLGGWLADRFRLQWIPVLQQMAQARQVGRTRSAVILAVVVVANAVVVILAVRAGTTGALTAAQLTVLLQGLVAMAALADPMGTDLVGYGSQNLRSLFELEKQTERGPGLVDRNRSPSQSARLPTRSAAGLPVDAIRFESVGFAYPGSDRAVFEDFDLTIEAGTSLGIVGLNGAGKTTLIKLLAGLETPSRGRITVDGHDLRDLDPPTWYRSVAAVFQDFVHYELTARENIAFGAVEQLTAGRTGPPGTTDLADETEPIDRLVLAAASRSGADEVLAQLPAGLDTPLSRRFAGGVDLSGGQWQRIALTRAIAAVENGSRVLVLDEPTAQLDVRAEADVYDRFLDLTKDLTTVVISHRFSTVRRAERIVVLDGGRITEDGTHEQLMATGGRYAQLFATQASAYITTDEAEGDDHAE